MTWVPLHDRTESSTTRAFGLSDKLRYQGSGTGGHGIARRHPDHLHAARLPVEGLSSGTNLLGIGRSNRSTHTYLGTVEGLL